MGLFFTPQGKNPIPRSIDFMSELAVEKYYPRKLGLKKSSLFPIEYEMTRHDSLILNSKAYQSPDVVLLVSLKVIKDRNRCQEKKFCQD